MASGYYKALPAVAQQRYREKLRLVGDIEDPYLLWEGCNYSRCCEVDWYNWPEVEYPDIYNYLIETPSLFTRESLKAYKSLDGYRMYSDGWVNRIRVLTKKDVTNPDIFMATCLVRHSQSVSAAPLKPWVGVKKTGCILVAHCTCMAGLGEACSHVAGLLFTLEANTKVKLQTACTSLPCSWLPPTFQDVTYEPISNINFSVTGGATKTDAPSDVKEPSDLEKKTFFMALSKTSGKPAVLSLVSEHCEPYVPLVESGKIPRPLTSLFNPDYLSLSYPDLLVKCEDVYDSYRVTEEHVKVIEKVTKTQSQSKIWYQQRAGRVTASRLKSALATSVANPSPSLIKSICYPESSKFHSAACRWGCVHEGTARTAYSDKWRKKHDTFNIQESGLVLSPKYPFMGASPDGLIKCKCCGDGVLEIKCPYSCRNKSFSHRMEEKGFFLEESDKGVTELKLTHSYYYQIQMQMKFCNVSYGDFVVWREKELFVQRITLDDDFITDALSKAQTFIKIGVLPELIGKYLTKEPTSCLTEPSEEEDQSEADDQSERVWCYCKKGEEGDMIACDNDACPIQWFHLSCLKLTLADVPKGKWYCKECYKARRKGKKR